MNWGYNPLILTIDPFASWDIQALCSLISLVPKSIHGNPSVPGTKSYTFSGLHVKSHHQLKGAKGIRRSPKMCQVLKEKIMEESSQKKNMNPMKSWWFKAPQFPCHEWFFANPGFHGSSLFLEGGRNELLMASNWIDEFGRVVLDSSQIRTTTKKYLSRIPSYTVWLLGFHSRLSFKNPLLESKKASCYSHTKLGAYCSPGRFPEF